MKFAIVNNGVWSGAVLDNPRTYQNKSLGSQTSLDTFRDMGLWPYTRETGGGEPWQEVDHYETAVDTVNRNVVETAVWRTKPLDTLASERIAEIEAKHAKILDGGFDYDFGTKTATLPDGTTEPAGVRMLQTRPGDRERWQATMQVAQQYIVSGNPSEPMRSFRTADNATVPMTAQDVADCLNAMQAKFGQALDAMWTHKDTVRSLTTADDVISYDITTGWP